MQKVIFIVGPTGIGKSALAVDIAKEVDGEIISADSMQIYKHCNIGTAKVTQEEMQNIPHWGLNLVSPNETFSVNMFVDYAKNTIDQIISRGKVPIVVGGTGLYVESLLYGFQFAGVGQDETYRAHLQNVLQQHGKEYLHTMLESIDKSFAQTIHPNQYKRVMRALEVYHVSGKLPEKQPTPKPLYNALLLGLEENREDLYKRINARVETMLAQGLVQEVQTLVQTYKVTENSQCMQGIGYKEVLSYLQGKLSYPDMVTLLKQNSRHYAKRQFTWFRRMKDVVWFTRNQKQEIHNKVKEFLCVK